MHQAAWLGECMILPCFKLGWCKASFTNGNNWWQNQLEHLPRERGCNLEFALTLTSNGDCFWIISSKQYLAAQHFFRMKSVLFVGYVSNDTIFTFFVQQKIIPSNLTFAWKFIWNHVYLSVYPYVHSSVYVTVSLSVCLSIH